MKPATAEMRHQGVACVTARDFRWERGDIKSISLLGNVLARQISADRGALETIMFRDAGSPKRRPATSGSRMKARCWAAQERACAGGHTRRAAARAVRRVRHRLQPASDLRSRRAGRDEVLLSSATKEILPVTRIDGEASATARCAASRGRCMAAVRGLPAGQVDDVAVMAAPGTDSLIPTPAPFRSGDGRTRRRLRAAVVAVARQFDPAFDETTVERRPSRAGKYLG